MSRMGLNFSHYEQGNVYAVSTNNKKAEFLERHPFPLGFLSVGLIKLVSWCFKPSHPRRIISGLKENFIKRFVVERTNKAEIRPEEHSEKSETCRENFWTEIQLKGPERQKQIQEQNKKVQASLVGLRQGRKL